MLQNGMDADVVIVSLSPSPTVLKVKDIDRRIYESAPPSIFFFYDWYV